MIRMGPCTDETSGGLDHSSVPLSFSSLIPSSSISYLSPLNSWFWFCFLGKVSGQVVTLVCVPYLTSRSFCGSPKCDTIKDQMN